MIDNCKDKSFKTFKEFEEYFFPHFAKQKQRFEQQDDSLQIDIKELMQSIKNNQEKIN